MIWKHAEQVFENCAVIHKVNDTWGDLSNMHNGYPFWINGVFIASSEALYQAMRFPHQPEWQRDILNAPHAMQAKMRAKKEQRKSKHSRTDWSVIQLDVMRWVLQLKLAAHPNTFGRILRASKNQPIVELSRNDVFWGATETEDGVLEGENYLGRLLMELRTALQTNPNLPRIVPAPVIENFTLLGNPIEVVEFTN